MTAWSGYSRQPLFLFNPQSAICNPQLLGGPLDAAAGGAGGVHGRGLAGLGPGGSQANTQAAYAAVHAVNASFVRIAVEWGAVAPGGAKSPDRARAFARRGHLH